MFPTSVIAAVTASFFSHDSPTVRAEATAGAAGPGVAKEAPSGPVQLESQDRVSNTR
jgi:hypothetical protein